MLRSGFLLFFLLSLTSSAVAGNWSQFRGPHFNGSADEENLPASWSQTENVVWTADLPGASAATPTVWGDTVFISSADRENDALVAMAIDRKTGNVRWTRPVANGIRRDSRSNFAAPTPATDGEVVVFFYGTGELVAFDFDGGVVWKRNICDDYGEFAFLWTFSTSPIIHEGRLYLQVLQRDTPVDGRGFSDKTNDSYLLALDPHSGKELFRVVRPSNAKKESREAFSTPIPYSHNGREELLVVGGDAISGHDLKTGEELWRWGTWNPDRITHWRLVPSPVAGEGVILACAPKRAPIYAVKAGGTGVLSDADLAWTSATEKVISSDVPTPAFAHGDFFILNKDRRVMLRVEPRTGKIKWQTKRLPGSLKQVFEASPLVADGKVYIIDHSGRVVVMDAESGDILSDIEMDEPRDNPTRSSLVAAQGQLFIRTPDKLYCIGSQ